MYRVRPIPSTGFSGRGHAGEWTPSAVTVFSAMTVSIHQPQYLPWLGYFDKMDRADAFVLLDNVQYKKNEFVNRNRIKSAAGWQWLTTPVRYRFPERIDEVRIDNGVTWRRQHAQALLSNYGKAPHFPEYRAFFEGTYDQPWERLCDLNIHAVRGLAELLGIRREMPLASGWALSDDPTGRLVDICRRAGADTYLSGAGGQGYLDLSSF